MMKNLLFVLAFVLGIVVSSAAQASVDYDHSWLRSMFGENVKVELWEDYFGRATDASGNVIIFCIKGVSCTSSTQVENYVVTVPEYSSVFLPIIDSK